MAVVGGGDAREMDRESWGVPSNGRPAFTSLEQLLSYNARGKPRAVFTRLSTGANRALEGELGCFEFPLVQGARLQLGRFDPAPSAANELLTQLAILELMSAKDAGRSAAELKAAGERVMRGEL